MIASSLSCLTRRARRLAAAALCTAAAAAAAAPVSYRFTGQVDSDSADRGWASFSGRFTFDSDAVDTIADAHTASYAQPTGAPWGLSLSFDGGPTWQLDAASYVLVDNDLGGADRLGVLAFGDGGLSSVSLSLFDFSAALFGSDALPLVDGGLTLASFDWSTLEFGNADGVLQGRLDALWCDSGCAAPDPGEPPADPGAVPEPGSVALATLGLAALAATRRRR